jgi:hypothetical protein
MSSSQFNTALFNQAIFGGAPLPPGPIVQAGNGLLYPALRKAGVTLGPGRTPSLAQFQDAIDELNRLVGSLNCDRMFIYSIDRAEYALDPPKASYTIGQPSDPFESVDFLAQRPQLIDRANILTDSIRYPLVLATDLQWADIGLQTMPDSIPEILYNDRASPVSTLYLWGQPMSGQVLELFVWHQVPYVMTITDVVTAPMQYVDALVLNLAVRLAPHFQKVLDQNVREDARISLMRLESINAPQPIADLSGGLGCGGNRYNVYSDETR